MRLGEIVQHTVYERSNSEESKNNSAAAVQRLEQLKESIVGQLQRIQQSNNSGGAGQNRKDNLQKQIDNIDKLVQKLTRQGGVNTSEPKEGTKPSPIQCDQFVKSKECGATDSAGIYRLGQDSEGNTTILFNQREKAVNAADSGIDAKQDDVPEEGEKAAEAPHDENVEDAPLANQDEEDKKESDKPPSDEGDEMLTTINTDRVDAEIRKIQKEKQQIQQEIRQAAGDDTRSAKLEKRLASIESELKMKDNDAYRMQHAQVTVKSKNNN